MHQNNYEIEAVKNKGWSLKYASLELRNYNRRFIKIKKL
jgi:hypothetical protein